jgi:hypothetical protein
MRSSNAGAEEAPKEALGLPEVSRKRCRLAAPHRSELT